MPNEAIATRHESQYPDFTKEDEAQALKDLHPLAGFQLDQSVQGNLAQGQVDQSPSDATLTEQDELMVHDQHAD